MTFEEFFKKKKINLTTLQQAEGGLFAEFKAHYDVMGEKSFDHTKKYWFNKLRRLYPTPPEVKVEKVIIENPLAEQTIVEALTSSTTDSPKAGFTPRFKAGATVAKPIEPVEPSSVANDLKAVEAEPEKTTPSKPRFKAGVTAPQPQETKDELIAEEAGPEPANPPAEPAKPKVGFTPRFKAGVTAAKPQEVKEEPLVEPEKLEPINAPAEPAKPKVGFTPRFKAGVTKAKPATDDSTEIKPENKVDL